MPWTCRESNAPHNRRPLPNPGRGRFLDTGMTDSGTKSFFPLLKQYPLRGGPSARPASFCPRPRGAGGDGPRQAKGLKPPFGNRAGPRPPEPTQAPHPATRGAGEGKRNRRDRAQAAARTRPPPQQGPCPRARPTAPRARRPYRRMEPAKGGHGKNTEVWPSSAHRSIPASANPSTPPHTPQDGGASPHDGTALRGVRIR